MFYSSPTRLIVAVLSSIVFAATPSGFGSVSAAGWRSAHALANSIVFVGSVDTTMHGGSGGTLFQDACPSGQALIGFTGQSGTQIDQITGQCGAVSWVSSGTLPVTPAGSLPSRGGFGGSPWSRICPTNNVIVGFSGRAGTGIDQLTFTCAPIIASGGNVFTVGTPTNLAPVGGAGGCAFSQTNCAPQHVAIAQRGRSGTQLDAFGLACGQPTLQTTAAAVTVSGRVTSADGRGVSKAVVTLSDGQGVAHRAITNGFGYYRFYDVLSGKTYVIAATSKQHQFSPRILTVTDDLTDVDLVAEASARGK